MNEQEREDYLDKLVAEEFEKFLTILLLKDLNLFERVAADQKVKETFRFAFKTGYDLGENR